MNEELLIAKLPVVAGVAGVTIFSIYRIWKKLPPSLSDTIAVCLASAGLPTGICLLLAACGFLPLHLINSIDLYLSVAGLVLIYTSFEALTHRIRVSANVSTIGKIIDEKITL